MIIILPRVRGGLAITINCSADLQGSIITATDGIHTLTNNCPSSSPYSVRFTLPNGGTWTISGTVDETLVSKTVYIPTIITLYNIPNGSTTTPTGNIQKWLNCADIWDKSYSTIQEVLSDTTTLLALISDNNAVDYMARSTTWANNVCADETAMSYIGANNYCADTLLADSTWVQSICNSTYFENVLNVKVPLMTSNTTPYGTVTVDGSYWASNYPYCAFDRNTNTYWTPGYDNVIPFVAYEFIEDVKIYKSYVDVSGINQNQQSTINYQYLNSSNQWVTYGSFSSPATKSERKQDTTISETPSARKFRVIDTVTKVSGYGWYINEVQFYGRAASST